MLIDVPLIAVLAVIACKGLLIDKGEFRGFGLGIVFDFFGGAELFERLFPALSFRQIAACFLLHGFQFREMMARGFQLAARVLAKRGDALDHRRAGGAFRNELHHSIGENGFRFLDKRLGVTACVDGLLQVPAREIGLVFPETEHGFE